MIKNPQEYINFHFPKFSSPVCSRFKQFFEQISNEKTHILNSKEIKSERIGKKNDNYKIEIEKIKTGEEKRTTLIIKGVPSLFGCLNFYNLLKNFYRNINFFFIPGYIYKQKEFMYAFVNVKYPKGVLHIYECIKIIKEKFENIFGYNLSGMNVNYCKTQGYRALKKKYTNEYFDNFLICE